MSETETKPCPAALAVPPLYPVAYEDIRCPACAIPWTVHPRDAPCERHHPRHRVPPGHRLVLRLVRVGGDDVWAHCFLPEGATAPAPIPDAPPMPPVRAADVLSLFLERHRYKARCEELEAEVVRLREEARRYYLTDGSYITLATAEEAVRAKILAARMAARIVAGRMWDEAARARERERDRDGLAEIDETS